MGKRNDDGWKTALRTAGQVSQIGFTFVFAVLISLGIGYWLDNQVGTDKLFKLVFLVLGLLSGGLSVYKTLSKFLDGDNK
ncbi:MAG: AtpZ/AtpI family protein [Candidatus Acetothermia bacterium]